MFSVAKEWNPKQALLKQCLSDESKFTQSIDLLLEMHALLHDARVSQTSKQTFMDMLWDGLDQVGFSSLSPNHHSIAWNIWHITRIEDITANILIAEQEPVLNAEWLESLNSNVTDTGNAMTPGEIMQFSQTLDIQAVRDYRSAVGRQTRKIIRRLQPSDLKRKVNQAQLAHILESGGVLNHPDSIWLLDFWGKKTVAGLILMPLTRHQVLHLNECQQIKIKLG